MIGEEIKAGIATVVCTRFINLHQTTPRHGILVQFESPDMLDEMERRHILATLNSTGWNKSQTANILGIERSTLDRKIRRYEIEGYLQQRGPRATG